MAQTKKRIGLIGYGIIGKAIHEMIKQNPENGMEVVFIHDISTDSLKDISKELILEDISKFDIRNTDLVIEVAHPDVTRKWGDVILKKCDYIFVSTTVLADKGMIEKIEETTKKYRTRAYVPHGGVIGMDALFENRNIWESVDIVMKKPPKNVDYANVGIDPETIDKETVLYDGPTRGVCPLFPRNVNTHATVAFAGIGFDRTHSVLIVSPKFNTAIVSINAKGKGVNINIERVEDITGVTGASTPASIYNSLQMIVLCKPGIHLR
jgi:aspartate dehydrogenase